MGSEQVSPGRTIEHRAVVPEDMAGQRLDRALAALFGEYSRSRLQGWIRSGRVLVDGRTLRPRDRLEGGEEVVLAAELTDETAAEPEPIPLTIIHEDEEILVLDKPAGLVVHPGAGNPAGTLVNALLHHRPGLRLLPRAGLVHRLDKGTSGVLVVACTPAAHASLVRQLAERRIRREYQAVCVGVMTGGGTVDAPIGRHPVERVRMAIRESGREAVTHYRILARFRAHTHVLCQLETGRTHQIRVHLASIRHPIVGDPVYGGRLALPKGASPALIEALRGFRRQALHAARLELSHPGSGATECFRAPLAPDFAALLAVLQSDAAL